MHSSLLSGGVSSPAEPLSRALSSGSSAAVAASRPSASPPSSTEATPLLRRSSVPSQLPSSSSASPTPSSPSTDGDEQTPKRRRRRRGSGQQPQPAQHDDAVSSAKSEGTAGGDGGAEEDEDNGGASSIALSRPKRERRPAVPMFGYWDDGSRRRRSRPVLKETESRPPEPPPPLSATPPPPAAAVIAVNAAGEVVLKRRPGRPTKQQAAEFAEWQRARQRVKQEHEEQPKWEEMKQEEEETKEEEPREDAAQPEASEQQPAERADEDRGEEERERRQLRKRRRSGSSNGLLPKLSLPLSPTSPPVLIRLKRALIKLRSTDGKFRATRWGWQLAAITGAPGVVVIVKPKAEEKRARPDSSGQRGDEPQQQPQQSADGGPPSARKRLSMSSWRRREDEAQEAAEDGEDGIKKDERAAASPSPPPLLPAASPSPAPASESPAPSSSPPQSTLPPPACPPPAPLSAVLSGSVPGFPSTSALAAMATSLSSPTALSLSSGSGAAHAQASFPPSPPSSPPPLLSPPMAAVPVFTSLELQLAQVRAGTHPLLAVPPRRWRRSRHRQPCLVPTWIFWMSYAELQITTNLSFKRGASYPDEYFNRAVDLGMAALGITDRNSLAGIVRAHEAARGTGLRLVVGCRLDLADGLPLLVYPTDRAAYARLCRLLRIGKFRPEQGKWYLTWADFCAESEGLLAILLPDQADANLEAQAQRLRRQCGDRAYLALTLRRRADDQLRLFQLSQLAQRCRVRTVVTNDVLYHDPSRRQLQDVITCIREGCTIDAAGFRRERFADRYLKSPAEMARLFKAYPEALERTGDIVARCRFSLDELHYSYPDESDGTGETAQQSLERLTWEGAAERYADGIPAKVAEQLRHELSLIQSLNYAPYFLTVHNIVRFARSKGILCQGRGSAANSAVCFVLAITAINPIQNTLLFERFVSLERREPPDIDVDFDSDRREEVIQWIYETYGRNRAALAAVVITYRMKSAIRDIGKVLGLPEDTINLINKQIWAWGREAVGNKQLNGLNLNRDDRRLQMTLELAHQLAGFPSHFSQHPGGFVLANFPLDELVPVQPATMKDRQIIEWDKNDIDTLKFMKVDVLGLGMLGCLSRAFDLLKEHRGQDLTLADIPGRRSGYL